MSRPVPISSTQAVLLLSELLELDLTVRRRRGPATIDERRRRRNISKSLRDWAMALEANRLGPGAGQREHPRAPVRIYVKWGEERLPCESLGLGGLSLARDERPTLGETVELEICPPQPDATEPVRAQVMWWDPKEKRVGLSFVDLSDTAQSLIERLVYTELVKTG